MPNIPAQTPIAKFQQDGSESAYAGSNQIHWTSTPAAEATNSDMYRIEFDKGQPRAVGYGAGYMVRAFRRELAEVSMTSSAIAEQKLNFATYENRSQVAAGEEALAEREALRQSLIADGASAVDIARVFVQTVTAQAQAIAGYYPLYETEADADAAGNGSSHSHEFDGVTYYMPDGGVDIYHGNYDSGDSGDTTTDSTDSDDSGATDSTDSGSGSYGY